MKSILKVILGRFQGKATLPPPKTLGELAEDSIYLDAVKACGERARTVAEDQSLEVIGQRDFMWGFYLGVGYERSGAISVAENCRRAGHVREEES